MRQSQQICRATGKTLPRNIWRALTDNRSVVVTGRSRTNDRNIPIGKTTVVLKGFVPMAERDGLEVEYFNLGLALPFIKEGKAFEALASNMDSSLKALREHADIFILNQAFHLFGPPQSEIYRAQMRPHIKKFGKRLGEKRKVARSLFSSRPCIPSTDFSAILRSFLRRVFLLKRR